MADDCIFCGIIAGDLPSVQVGENEAAVAVRDINPRAPVHLLVVPRRHRTSAHELTADDGDELAQVFTLAREVATAAGTADGYRVVTNIGRGGGQMVDHLHFHVLGGRQLRHIDSGTAPDD